MLKPYTYAMQSISTSQLPGMPPAGASPGPAQITRRRLASRTPELSPAGPISVVLSRSDQRAVVLRNGVEIGRARIAIPDTDFTTHALTLTRGADGQAQWIYAAVPGHAGESGQPLDSTVLQRLKAPKAFQEAVMASLGRGDTVLVTQAPINAGSSGPPLAVLSDAMPAAR